MGQTGFCENLRFRAVFRENLRFPAVFCASEMLQFSGKAKICKNQRKTANLAPFVPFSLFLLIPRDHFSCNPKDPAVLKILRDSELLRRSAFATPPIFTTL